MGCRGCGQARDSSVALQAKDALTGGGGLPNPFEAIKNAVTGGSGPDLPDPRDAASKITGKVGLKSRTCVEVAYCPFMAFFSTGLFALKSARLFY